MTVAAQKLDCISVEHPADASHFSRSGALKLLSLSCVYPNPREPGLGLFVRSRLQHMAASAELKVIAPVGQVTYAHAVKNWVASERLPFRRWDGPLEVLHPRWVYPPGGGPVNCLLLFLQLIRLARGLRSSFPFQVIDSHFAHPEGITACLLARALGSPFTVTLRGSEMTHSCYPLRRWFMAWALRRANRVIAVSEELRQLAIRLGADPAKVKKIPNGIDAQVFSPRDRLASRLKHGIPPEPPVILSAGHLIELKGFHRVIRAVKALHLAGVPAQLLIAGDSGTGRRGYEHRLRRLVSDLGLDAEVRFLGQVDYESLAEIMSAADVFCLASTREGWPNVVHESLACGTPVVATQVGAVRDLIPSEQYGFIVPVSDQAALQQALQRAIHRQWDRDALSAWAHSRSWDQVAREVLDEFRQVVAEHAQERLVHR